MCVCVCVCVCVRIFDGNFINFTSYVNVLFLIIHIFPRWSYGVVLWEMYSCGMVPYSGMKSHELVEYLNEGRRMKPPDQCPEQIYNIMLECWNDDPDSRPSMLQLYDKLDVLMVSVSTEDVSIQVFVVKKCMEFDVKFSVL